LEAVQGRSQTEVAAFLGVTQPTVRKWADKFGVDIGYRCCFCNEVKPRPEFISPRRCRLCHDSMIARTLTVPKTCSACKEIKPYNQFPLKNTAPYPAAHSECNACSLDRWKDVEKAEPLTLGALASWSSVRMSTATGPLSYWQQPQRVDE